MAIYGLTDAGLVVKTIGVIRDDLNAALRQVFGASVNLGDESIIGQMTGIVSEAFAKVWELIEGVNSGRDPDAATGAALEQICLLTGTLRPPASYSAVGLILTGDDTTVVPASRKLVTLSTGIEFTTDSAGPVTITAVGPWVAATAYVAGDRVSSNGGVYQCTSAGTSHATTGPGPAPLFPDPDTAAAQDFNDVADGTAVWLYCGEGDGAVDVVAQASETGPKVAVAYDIRGEDAIVDVVAGWSGVVNPLDASVGNDAATDADLRILREQELQSGGSSPIDALRAELLEVPGVVATTIFQNVNDVTDGDGIPPHSIEALVRGPDAPDADFDQSIFDALLAGVAAGIRTHADPAGTPVTGTALDSEGTAHTMKFSRPTNVNIWVDVELTKDPDNYPSDGDDQVKLAIVEYGDAQNTGKDVVASALIGAIFAAVPGILDVTLLQIDDAAAPSTSTTIPISLRQLAVFDTSRITVVSIDGVP